MYTESVDIERHVQRSLHSYTQVLKINNRNHVAVSFNSTIRLPVQCDVHFIFASQIVLGRLHSKFLAKTNRKAKKKSQDLIADTELF